MEDIIKKCKRDHLLTEDNLYVWVKNNRTQITCKICHKDKAELHRKKTKLLQLIKKPRVCETKDCTTILSIYNEDSKCALHSKWDYTKEPKK